MMLLLFPNDPLLLNSVNTHCWSSLASTCCCSSPSSTPRLRLLQHQAPEAKFVSCTPLSHLFPLWFLEPLACSVSEICVPVCCQLRWSSSIFITLVFQLFAPLHDWRSGALLDLNFLFNFREILVSCLLCSSVNSFWTSPTAVLFYFQFRRCVLWVGWEITWYASSYACLSYRISYALVGEILHPVSE